MWTVRSALLLILVVQLVLLVTSARGCAQVSARLDATERALAAARVASDPAAADRAAELRAALAQAEHRLATRLGDTLSVVEEVDKRVAALQTRVDALEARLSETEKTGPQPQTSGAGIDAHGGTTAAGEASFIDEEAGGENR